MEKTINENFYYIAYSFIEEENSANQIQTKNTFENLKKINPSFKGIFLGNKKNFFWNTRREGNNYFVDMVGYKIGIIGKYFKIRTLEKNLFPCLFALKAARILKKDENKKNIYARLSSAEEAIFYLKKLDELNINKIVFELHHLTFDVPRYYYWNFERRYCRQKYFEFFTLLKNNHQRARLVSLTKNLANIIENRFNYKKNIEIIPDAHNFINHKPKNIHFRREKIEIIYTGLTFRNRGVEIIINALKFLPNNFCLRFVGGRESERENLRKKYAILIKQNRFVLESPAPYFKIKEKLVNADIAIIPTPIKGFSDFTSPLKLFDYMAIGLPIIASNTPVFREIINERNVLFFEENNSKDLSEKIIYLAENEEFARKIGKRAHEDSKKYTYQERAQKIVNLFA